MWSFSSPKIFITWCAHIRHIEYIRHIFDEISMTGENDCLDSIWRAESAICRHECRNTRSFRTLWHAKSVSSKKMRDNSPTGSFTVTIPRSRIWRKNVKNMKKSWKKWIFQVWNPFGFWGLISHWERCECAISCVKPQKELTVHGFVSFQVSYQYLACQDPAKVGIYRYARSSWRVICT